MVANGYLAVNSEKTIFMKSKGNDSSSTGHCLSGYGMIHIPIF
jgi:hypothetical protein